MIRAISFLLTFFMSFLSAQAILPQPTGTMASRAASAGVTEKGALLSPGIAAVAASEKMAVSAKAGGEAAFEAEDFEAAVPRIG